jgi:hypothetical protein
LLSVAVAVVTLLGQPAAPAQATHAFHAYSYMQEWSSPYAYTGLYARRPETPVSGSPYSGCSTVPYSYQPVYFTQWVSINPGVDWLEIGTGHQCSNDMKYWFWGYGWQGNWYPLGEEWNGIYFNEYHYFEVYRVATTWYWYINGLNRDTMYWNAVGTRVRVGMESWNGHTTTPWTTIDTMNKTISEGPYTPLSYTSTVVNTQMCGQPLSANSYQARERAATGTC